MGEDSYMGFEKYFQLEGAAYRVVPIETPRTEYYDYGRIDADILYDNLMNKFVWGNIKDPKVNMDFFHDNTIGVMKYRNTFLRLAQQLYEAGENEKAIAALDKSLEEIPLYQVPADNNLLNYIPLYYNMQQPEKADMLLRQLADNNYQMLKYLYSLEPKYMNDARMKREEEISINVIRILIDMATRAGQKDLAMEIRNKVESIYNPMQLRTPAADTSK